MASVVRKLEPLVWYTLLATIGWQARIVLWQADPMFLEWRSMSVWSSDMLMAILFVTAYWQGWRPRLRGADWLLAGVVCIAVLSLVGAGNPAVGVYAVVRLAQYMLLYLYVRHWALHRFDTVTGAAVFVAGATLQAALGIAQFTLRHDVGFRIFGEPLLSTNMHGVAVFYDLAHHKVLRAYGTTPHPNVLATILMSATWVLTWLYARHGSHTRGETAVWATTAIVVLWALFLTFSRTMLAAWVVVSGVIVLAAALQRVSDRWANISVLRRRIGHTVLMAGAAGAVFFACYYSTLEARLTVQSDDEAVSLRVRYARDALSSGGGSGKDINWTGIGIGNFTTWLREHDPALPAYLQQPAHNIYLLAYAEIGLVGLALWLAWLVSIVTRAWRAHGDQPLVRVGVLAMLGAFIFIGFFDHFFWTLEPGRLLWWLALAVAAGRSK